MTHYIMKNVLHILGIQNEILYVDAKKFLYYIYITTLLLYSILQKFYSTCAVLPPYVTALANAQEVHYHHATAVFLLQYCNNKVLACSCFLLKMSELCKALRN